MTPRPEINQSDKISRILLNRNVLIVAIITLSAFPAFIKYGGYMILGDGTLQELAFITEAKRMLSSGAPWWSWNTYFGDNYIGSNAYYIFINIFSLANTLFPYEYIALGFTLMLYLKFLLCGYVCDRYLGLLGFDKRLRTLGSLLFTFSSFAICNQQYYFFMEPMIMFVVVLICIERFLARSRLCLFWLAMSCAGACLANFYFAPAILGAAALYLLCRLISGSDSYKSGIIDLAIAFACCILGILLAAVLLVPQMMFLSDSERVAVAGGPDMLNILMRALSLFMPSFHEGHMSLAIVHSSANSNQANIAVFGILAAALFVAKARRNAFAWFLICCVIIYLTPLNGIFVLFTSYEYSRWAFVLIMAIVVTSLLYFRDFGPVTVRPALIYVGVCVALYGVFAGAEWYIKLFRTHEVFGHEHLRLIVLAALIVIDSAVLLWLARKGFPNHYYRPGVGLIVLCIIVQFTCFTFAQSDFSAISLPQNLGASRYYIDNNLPLDTASTMTHRTDFVTRQNATYIYHNAGALKNRPSVQTYNSVKNPFSRNIFRMAIIPGTYQTAIFSPNTNRTSFDALMSVRNVIVYDDPRGDKILPEGLANRTQGNGYSIYDFGHYIPMGFTYDRYISTTAVSDAMSGDTLPDIPRALLASVAIDDKDIAELSPYLLPGRLDTDASLDSVVAVRRSEVCTDFKGDTRGFTATTDFDSTRVVFFSVIADPGFTATIDGRETRIYSANMGLSAVVVPDGHHTIRFDYFPPGLKIGMAISAVALLLLLVGVCCGFDRAMQKKQPVGL